LTSRFFFDTSVLIKLYHEENGTTFLDQLLIEQQPIIVISDLSIIEMISALARKVRTQDVTPEMFEQVVTAFEKDVPAFERLSLNRDVQNRAIALLKKYGLQQGLRTLDALQLASALIGNEKAPLDKFIAADKTLVNVAKKEALSALLV
jgi:uncharacterized protein